MIILANEQLVPLAEAARLVPPGRSGQRTHISTVVRWILKGAKGPDGRPVRLEALRIGGRWMTSREALQRFAEALTPALADQAGPVPVRGPGARRRASERAAQELVRLGI
jgi:hypothetical protein